MEAASTNRFKTGHSEGKTMKWNVSVGKWVHQLLS